MITDQTVVKRIKELLDLVAAPWCTQCREKMKQNGHDRTGAQRFYCGNCQISTGDRRGYGKNHRSIRKAKAIELFESGHSLRSVCRMTGLHRMTAAKYRRDARPTLCKCGQAVKHQGWCWWRYQNSPQRQEFMKTRWHSPVV